MGLEYQARSWVFIGTGDCLENPDPDERCLWHTTGCNQQFRHCAADAKWLAFSSAIAVSEGVDHLHNSMGFLSLCADYFDVGPGYDRAYWLRDGLHEIDIRNTHLSQSLNDGLRDHFGFCRSISLSVGELPEYLSRFPNYAQSRVGALPIAGWFYLHHADPEVEAARDLFDASSIAIGRSSGWDDSYIFYGDIAEVDSVVASFRELSKRFPAGAGIIFPIYPRAIDQIAIFRGEAFQFFRIAESEIPFHSDLRFFTNRHGYEPR